MKVFEDCACGAIQSWYSERDWDARARTGRRDYHWPKRLGGCDNSEPHEASSTAISSTPPVSPPASANPKEHYGAQKPALGLIPPVSLLHCAAAFEDGAKRYGAFNWRTSGVESMTYIHAAMRHLQNYLDGEERASDSGVHNLGAVMACCAILLDAGSLGKLEDNRPPKGKSSETQDAMKLAKAPLEG